MKHLSKVRRRSAM